jgi:hypothetical protein
VLEGLETLPEWETLDLFTAREILALQRERLEWLQVQLPRFQRGDEDGEASVLLIFV